MTSPRRHILIFHQAALGDFVTTWPLAMALGRVFAQSRVMYVTGTDKGRLAEDAIGVEGQSADAGWHMLHGDADPPEPIARILRGTQCVVLFAQNDGPAFVANLAKHAGDVPLIHIRPKPPAGVHVWAHQLAQLDGEGKLKGYVEQMQTLVATAGLAKRGGPADGGVLIHPGSGSPAKNWPLTKFVDVASRLKSAGHAVRFVVGEVERDAFPPADFAAMRAVAEIAEPADLPSLRTVLSQSAAYLGNDSGPTHLAAAIGLPTVAVFGPASSVDQWRPRGPRVDVAAFNVSVDDVLRMLKR